MNKPLYRLDWGLHGKSYELRHNRPVWIEGISFSNKQIIFDEKYREITYQEYLALSQNDQIVDEYNENGPITFEKRLT